MEKTLKFNEPEFRVYVRDIVCHNINLMGGEERPFTDYPIRYLKTEFEEMADSNELTEGLIRTYPCEWVEKYLARRINSDFRKTYMNYMYGYFGFILKPGSNSIEPLKRKMDSFGYYLAVEDNVDEGVYLQFEPKYTESVKGSEFPPMGDNVFFYHVSPTYLKEKILEKGLVPKSKNGLLKYPDRIYLIKKTEGVEAARGMANLLCMQNTSKMNNGLYSLFGVTLRGLRDVDFYIDRNSIDVTAYFTYENIPPKNVVFIEDFDAME